MLGIIRSPDYTMEEKVRVARTLRETHRFGGYIHLKVRRRRGNGSGSSRICGR